VTPEIVLQSVAVGAVPHAVEVGENVVGDVMVSVFKAFEKRDDSLDDLVFTNHQL